MKALQEIEKDLDIYQLHTDYLDDRLGYRCCELALAALKNGCYGVGADRHSRHGKAGGCWPFAQQALDIACRDVSFDKVPINPGCMTGSVTLRHAESFASSGYLRRIVRDYREPRLLQVCNPLAAAAAVRVLPNLNPG